MELSGGRSRWYEGLTSTHWVMLAVASAGWIFDVYEGQPCVAFCDEDGKGKNLTVNRAATVLWAMAFHKRSIVNWRDIEALNDVLVGPVVILTGDEEFMASL